MIYIYIGFVQISNASQGKDCPFQKTKNKETVVVYIKRKREKVSKIKRKNFSNKSRDRSRLCKRNTTPPRVS